MSSLPEADLHQALLSFHKTGTLAYAPKNVDHQELVYEMMNKGLLNRVKKEWRIGLKGRFILDRYYG